MNSSSKGNQRQILKCLPHWSQIRNSDDGHDGHDEHVDGIVLRLEDGVGPSHVVD